MLDYKQQLNMLKEGCVELIGEKELVEKLESGRPLNIKAGFDPTAPDLHLGHMVLLQKLKQLQDLGHNIIFLVGDFTALIGDPTGKSVTRQPLTPEQVKANAITYQNQVFKVLCKKRTRIVYNSDWMKKLGSEGMLRLASNYTVARMLERDDFNNRFERQQAISIHEFLYPLIQGYDSVALEADLEVGGTDQKFNLLMGRELQKKNNITPQAILTMPLLEGLDGIKKMSKSLNNYVGIDESPDEIFGKLMSISDELMWRYFDLISENSAEIVASYRELVSKGENPKNIKIKLSYEFVARFYDDNEAQKAQESFENRFNKKLLPEQIPKIILDVTEKEMPLVQALKKSELVNSTSDAMRLIKQGAVSLNQTKVLDKSQMILASQDNIVKVGKRKFANIFLRLEN